MRERRETCRLQRRDGVCVHMHDVFLIGSRKEESRERRSTPTFFEVIIKYSNSISFFFFFLFVTFQSSDNFQDSSTGADNADRLVKSFC